MFISTLNCPQPKGAAKKEDKKDYKAHLKEIGEKYPGIAIVCSGGNIKLAAELLTKRAGGGGTSAYVELKMANDMLKRCRLRIG